MSDTPQPRCERCGGEMADSGPPINDVYCLTCPPPSREETLREADAIYARVRAQSAAPGEALEALERLEKLRHVPGQRPSRADDLALVRGALREAGEDTQRLLRFAGLMLMTHRNGGEPGDVDGGDMQDFAERTGMLVSVRVERPCAEVCPCAEYGEFPMDCLRLSDTGKRAIDAARGNPPPQDKGKACQPPSEADPKQGDGIA